MRRLVLLFTALWLAGSVVACGSSGDTQLIDPVSESGSAAASTQLSSCWNEPKPDVVAVETAVGGVTLDADGDGDEDIIETRESDGGRSLLMMRLGSGLDVEILIESSPHVSRPLGGYDIDGDGRDEVFVTVGHGAYAIQIGIFVFEPGECRLVRVETPLGPDGQMATLGFGASVGNGVGLACRSEGGNHFIEAVRAHRLGGEQPDDSWYEATTRTYELTGSELMVVAERNETIGLEAYGEATRLACGVLSLGPQR